MTDAWKACDIRGVFPDEVSPALARGVGCAIGSMLPLHSRVLIAGDFRLSTPALKRALAQGLISAGATVLDAGQIPTPIAYFAHDRLGTRAVMIVTASHNPADYNGIKLMIGPMPPRPADLVELREAVARADFRQVSGRYEEAHPVAMYKEWVLGRWAQLANVPQPVVLDSGGGAWGLIAAEVFESLGVRVTGMFTDIDPTFSCRAPDCARPRNLSALRNEVKRTRAALGVAWDGDGDRVAFVDETGSWVSADEISALLAEHLLATHEGEKVVYDIKLADIVPRSISKANGIPLVERSGHAFAKRRMIEENCLLGCEVSGHYFFRELKGGDDGLFAALLVTNMVAGRGPLGQLRQRLDTFFITPDIRVSTELVRFGEIVRRLRSLFSGAQESTLDGVRLMTPIGSILARESVTEPVVTMRLEGNTRTALDTLIESCVEALPEFAQELQNQIAKTED